MATPPPSISCSPKDAIRAVKKRLNGNKNYREVMLALTVLETCVKNCGHRFHVLVATRDFIDGVLVKIISPKSNPPTIVQDKVLALIQAWADAFRSSPDLTGVVHIYEELKRKGIEFPMADLDALSPIHTPQRGVPEVDPATHKYKAGTAQHTGSAPPASTVVAPAYNTPQVPSLQMSGSINANSEQIARLRSELDIVRGNAKVMSEMLTEMVPGQEDPSDLELLQVCLFLINLPVLGFLLHPLDGTWCSTFLNSHYLPVLMQELNRTCRAMQQRIVELISRVSNEEVTEELLHVNDDLNNIFLRYERYERYRSGRTARSSNNGVLSEATEDNLIDLGPGSPAVVSPMVSVAPTPGLPSAAPAAAATTATPDTLSTQLAGLDVSNNSVSGTLSSLPRCHPKDDFDMFAQTRGSSLADQRKNVKYEDPQALGGLASALDVRQQNTGGLSVKGDNADMEPIDGWLISQGMIPVAQSSVMDDIEEWLCTDVKGDDAEEGVTSEEFDKFLEERAKAAETSLPSPPGGNPATATATAARAPSGSRKKAERSEDALFAL
uniref:Target of myb1 like 2 membrane trafficking protein n=1 Tax=Paramormyrops kingsleyae TaxID=1676925 RepID=A0A3B3T888_9TELE